MYYFEILPLHPPPNRLESLTSYLARLGLLNGLVNKNDLLAMVFPDQPPASIKPLLYCLPPSFGALSAITTCPEDILRATTLLHFVRKLGRAATFLTATKFLEGSLSPHLRFCPLCLEQYNYYKLVWCFNQNIGCSEHHCQLLEGCGQCNREIPLLTNPLTLGKCPYCKTELKSSAVKKLAESEDIIKLETINNDLEFLLSPHPKEEEGEKVIIELGEELRRRRVARGETIKEVANRLALKSSEIFFVEEGRIKNGTAPFRTYVEYIYYNGISIKEMYLLVEKRVDNT